MWDPNCRSLEALLTPHEKALEAAFFMKSGSPVSFVMCLWGQGSVFLNVSLVEP